MLWRKFAKDERESADTRLNEFCYDLIVRRNYGIAEAILSFGTKVLAQKGNDRTRRMMLINLANAIRLQKRQTEAVKLLDTEDWSAVSDDFQISVAAVRGDIDAVVTLLKKIGRDGDPGVEQYRTWPVFKGIRSDPKFSEAFLSVFGEPVIRPTPAEITLQVADAVSLSPEVPQGTKLH